MFTEFREEFQEAREVETPDPLLIPRGVEQASRWDTNDPRPADVGPRDSPCDVTVHRSVKRTVGS